jgi:type IV secretion system protein VirD4
MTMSDVSKTGLRKVGGVFVGRAGGRLAEILSPGRDQNCGLMAMMSAASS